MKTFETHAVMATSNFGGYEIQLSEDGQQARVRYNIGYGTTKYRWQLIKYNDEGEPFVTFRGKRLMLGWFMRVNN